MTRLKNGKPIKKNSHLALLNPILDAGLLRLKGRLVSDNTKNVLSYCQVDITWQRWLFVTIMRPGVSASASCTASASAGSWKILDIKRTKHYKKGYQRLHQVQKSTSSNVYAAAGTLTWRTDDTGQTAFLIRRPRLLWSAHCKGRSNAFKKIWVLIHMFNDQGSPSGSCP